MIRRLLIVSALTAVSAFADDSLQLDALTAQVERDVQRIEALENKISAYQDQESQRPSPHKKDMMCGGVAHSSHGCLGVGFTIQAEFLYWRANMDNLYFAQNSGAPVTIGPNAGGTLSFRTVEPDFKYDPGVRVAIGYDFGPRNWDILLAWTYHYTDPTTNTGSDNNPLGLIATNIQTAANGFENILAATTARASWETRLNVLDFEMGYDYFKSRWCSLRPYFGLKAAWIHMRYDYGYTGLLDSDTNIPQATARSHSDFWGVGPRMGMDGYLHMGWGFSLYGDITGALIYGQYDTHRRGMFQHTTDLAPTDVSQRQHDYSRLRSVVEMAVGLEWSYCFSDTYLLAFHIGWENQYWWNQLALDIINRDDAAGDLTYSGLDVGARFDF